MLPAKLALELVFKRVDSFVKVVGFDAHNNIRPPQLDVSFCDKLALMLARGLVFQVDIQPNYSLIVLKELCHLFMYTALQRVGEFEIEACDTDGVFAHDVVFYLFFWFASRSNLFPVSGMKNPDCDFLAATVKRFAAVIITGGSSGIGNEFLKAIVKVGLPAVICNLSRTKPSAFPEGANYHHIPCDLADGKSFAGALETLKSLIFCAPAGELLLINNSGFGTIGDFPAPGAERVDEMISVNVAAPVRLTGELWPVLQERGGQIVNIASISAFQPTPAMGVYGATKAFLLHWSLALDVEGRRRGIRALAVCPGTTRTKFFDVAGMPAEKICGAVQSPEQVVRESFRAMARGKSVVVCGRTNKLAMFFAARLPKVWAAKAAYAMLRGRAAENRK